MSYVRIFISPFDQIFIECNFKHQIISIINNLPGRNLKYLVLPSFSFPERKKFTIKLSKSLNQECKICMNKIFDSSL